MMMHEGGGFRRPRCGDKCCYYSVCIAITLVVAGLSIFGLTQTASPARYYVSIDSVSGLDPATDLATTDDPAGGGLKPEFKLTLGVASRSLWEQRCTQAGTEVRVRYRGVLLATSEPARRQCAPARKSVEQPVFAWSSGSGSSSAGVRLPGVMRDSLAEGIRRGEPVFDVALGSEDSNSSWASCGEAGVAAASPTWCQ